MRTTDTMAGAGSTADGDCDLSLLPDLPDPAIKVCRDHCCVWIIVHYERAREGLCIAHGLAGTAVAARGGGLAQALRHQAKQRAILKQQQQLNTLSSQCIRHLQPVAEAAGPAPCSK